MTIDTTDQQAATVAQLLPCPFCGNPQPQWVGSGAGNYVECGSCLATMPPHDDDVPGETDRWNTRLASVSSASAELATATSVDDDYTRAFIAGWNATRDHSDFDMALHYWMLSSVSLPASPAPVPATNQAGEAPDADWAGDWQGDTPSNRTANLARERQPEASLEDITAAERFNASLKGRVLISDRNLVVAEMAKAFAARRLAALATQPATSQGKVENGAGKSEADADGAEKPATSQEGEARPIGEAIRKAKQHAGRVLGISWCNLEEISRVELIIAERDRLAATPTPPTLSEDLREVIEHAVSVLERLPYGDWPGPMYSGKTVAANALIRRLRAALAQVKAS